LFFLDGSDHFVSLITKHRKYTVFSYYCQEEKLGEEGGGIDERDLHEFETR
jgi:hypothetical protein